MATEGLAARGAAVAILGAVLSEGQLMSEVLADPRGPLAGLTPSDKARAQRLAAMVLRHLEQTDKVLDVHLRKGPPRMVQNALRLALCEMAIDGAAPHGVVNAAVDLVRRGGKTRHMAGLVNAVLRKLSEVPEPFAGMPPQRMPMWLRKPLVHRWGREVVAAIEAVQAQGAPLDLTCKPGVVPAIAGANPVPTGSLRIMGNVQVSALPGYEAGDWWVQDAAAALPVRMLAPMADEQVLDLCAAPGGKTMQLAAAGARVTALDISGPRMARVRENLARTGLSADCVVADAMDWQGGPFDAVLLDAPCSASGTIRRHPDLPFVKDGSELPGLVDLQARLLDRALTLARPGGRVIFCTCSLLAEEGEDQIVAALARHPGLSVEPPEISGIESGWVTPEGGLRLRPDYWAAQGGMDGFYIARLRVSG